MELRSDALHRLALLMSSDELRDFVGREGTASQGHTGALEDPADGLTVNAELGGQLVDGRPCLVGGDQCGGLVVGELGEGVLGRRLLAAHHGRVVFVGLSTGWELGDQLFQARG